jgi:hypothetical protein
LPPASCHLFVICAVASDATAGVQIGLRKGGGM